MSQKSRQSTDQDVDQDILTPEHKGRKRYAEAEAERKRTLEVVKEWVEVVKRYPQENGKVILRTQTNHGHTYSRYEGKESNCKDYLAKMEKEGKYKPFRSR